MNEYRVLETLRLPSHQVVGLDAKQADARMHNLEKTDHDGVFVTREPIEFKVGERIGFAETAKQLDRAIASRVEAIKGSRPAPAASSKAQDDAS